MSRPVTPHRPYVVTTTDKAGRSRAQCLTCMESSPASFHGPVAAEWRKAHIKQATQQQETKP